MSNLLTVLYVLIDFGVYPWNHKVSEEDRPRGDHVSEDAVKFLNVGLKQLVKPLPVFSVHQPVLEHPAALVVPEPQQVLFSLTKHHMIIEQHNISKYDKNI